MCEGSRPHQKDCEQLQIEMASLVRSRMQAKGVSLRCLVDNKIIKSSHRNHFFERLAEGTLSYAEVNKLTAYLDIDPVRAAITVHCFDDPEVYDDPCCETSADVAVHLAHELTEEIAAIEDGNFQPLRDSLCKGSARKLASAIAKNHVDEQRRQNDFHFLDKQFG